ncbi:aminoglycoside phosphotransferase family protein [Microlunatus elymi]|uniref:Aminoglycoside phosphotransferase family protein n=1 Tax=Microlunatus elymi TaxID=2596828 RepID=A0A516Q4H9_9ACTN|nr:aminoglycoside phosphotransferase family protein [Microlunatus elymi]QDP98347.1 aminoglycoside phosphotransferase family protein [Microlunatus elymi]
MHPPPSTTVPLSVPVGQTAQRPEWVELPAAVRDWVQDQLGAAVVVGRSQRSGYTPGFASRLELADGRRVFVKIAGWERAWLLDSYANEAIKRRTLPAGVPAPKLLWDGRETLQGTEWLALIFEDIDGRHPRRPWQPAAAAAAVAAVERAAQLLSPAPAGFDWQPLSTELGGITEDKEEGIRQHFGDHAGELRELVAGFAERCSGTTLVHGDLRDDNLIIDAGGRAWICDWNFPMLAKPYVDLVTLLLSMRGDGLDADAILAASPLVTADDTDGIDSLLADLGLYYLIAAEGPEPDGSPYLRRHQRWNRDVTLGWLADRRGWR